VLGSGGVWLNSPSAQTTPALIRLNLRSSAHAQGNPNTGIPNSRRQKTEYLKQQGHAMACPCCVLGFGLYFCLLYSDFPVLAGPRSAETSGSGLALFERSAA
jgi:hypothetical protein